jgi:S1-C subfamily serine protease
LRESGKVACKTLERKLVIGIGVALAVLVLMVGSCFVGALLAPRLADALPRMEWRGADVRTVPPVVTREVVPQSEGTRAAEREPAPAASPTPIPSDVLEEASAEERLVASVYERVAPSVVHIRVVQHVSGGEAPQIEIPGWPDHPELPDDFYRRGEGSGFIWDRDGDIVTNYHVVQDAEEVEVTFLDGVTLPAEVVGTDPDSDLAVLKVERPGDQLNPVALGDSDRVFVGQRAIAIGNPFGQEWTLTTGVVSALGRTQPSGTSQFSIPEMIQTDAAINPGSSGGPLLDREGNVIGVNTLILSEDRASAGVGFAIPVNTVNQVVPVLIEEGQYAYAWLGIVGRDLDRETALAMDLPADQDGALVIEVVEDSPAEEAGLQGSDETITRNGAALQVGGDVVVAIDAQQVSTMDDLIVYLVEEARPDQRVTLTVLRDSEERTVEVTLGRRPREVSGAWIDEGDHR